MPFDSIRLGELAAKIPNAIAAGPFGSNLVGKDYVPSGVPVIRGQNLQGRFIGGEFVFVTKEKASSLKSNSAKPGDVVFTQRGTLGQVALVPQNSFSTYIVSQSQMKITVDIVKVSPEFVYYATTTTEFIKQVHDNAVAAGVPHINLGTLRQLTIPLPNRDEQGQIVCVLSSLDDKIAILRETNATIEAIAQALFKSWFVDFDPVHAKAQGRDPVGIPSEVADLFPSEFEESELGMIPAGWEAGTLDALAELNPESWSTRNHPHTLLYVDLANTKDNRIDSVTEYLFKDAPSRARRVLRSGDTIVGTVRPGNRSFAFIQSPPEGLTGSTGFAVLRPRNFQYSEFTFIAATRNGSIDILASLADGGAYPAVRPEVVHKLKVVVPPDTIISAFHRFVGPLMQKSGANNVEVGNLANLRDALLPPLMSGKLRVSEVAEVPA